jgi:hydroxymethylbilane synthase
LTSIRIGTRGSKLALWQAGWVAEQLQQHGYTVELIVVTTQGDTSTSSLSQVGGQGLFTKEIQRELLANRVDVAVHSLKDLPTLPIEGLVLAAVPPRETTDDCLISRHGLAFEDLPAGAVIGTGSSRRAAQLRAWRADIRIGDIRGNIDSRLNKLYEEQFDAIVLAAAGLQRLGLTEHITQRLPVEQMLPAIGQGALGLECRSDDHATCEALVKLDDFAAHAAVVAERSLLKSLLAGCLAPVAALGTIAAGRLTLRGRVISLDGSRCLDGSVSGNPLAAEELGEELSERLREQGAAEIIERARLQM